MCSLFLACHAGLQAENPDDALAKSFLSALFPVSHNRARSQQEYENRFIAGFCCSAPALAFQRMFKSLDEKVSG